MRRAPLIRQTYTTASLVAMIPAAIWAAVAYNSNTMNGTIGAFPFYYLVFCQVMIIPRYVLAAWVVVYLGRYKAYSPTGGFIGFVAAGVIADIWLTAQFARAVAEPPGDTWAGFIPLVLFPYALAAMLLAAVAGGFVAGRLRGKR